MSKSHLTPKSKEQKDNHINYMENKRKKGLFTGPLISTLCFINKVRELLQTSCSSSQAVNMEQAAVSVVTGDPYVLNRGADLLLRGNPLYGDWCLHPQIVSLLSKRFGQVAVDLFASRENAHCPMIFTLRDEDAPLGVDALAHPWPNALLYAFPPLCLIMPTLVRVREQRFTLQRALLYSPSLIAPRWPKAPWLAEIISLLYAQPWPLPSCTDLLSQSNREILHPQVRVALWAWPVKRQT